MKFRNPKTGEVFDVTDGAPGTGFCSGIRCYECPIRSAHPYCKKFINEHPNEAAALMGYEVVEDHTKEEDTFFQALKESLEQANMDKPLKDWTLLEVQKYCKRQRSTDERCSTCKIQKFCDKYLGRKGDAASPKYWDLSEKPRFTEREVERAKAVKVLYPEIYYIKNDDGWLRGITKGKESIFLDGVLSWFPSVQPGQSYTLDEIIGGAK